MKLSHLFLSSLLVTCLAACESNPAAVNNDAPIVNKTVVSQLSPDAVKNIKTFALQVLSESQGSDKKVANSKKGAHAQSVKRNKEFKLDDKIYYTSGPIVTLDNIDFALVSTTSVSATSKEEPALGVRLTREAQRLVEKEFGAKDLLIATIDGKVVSKINKSSTYIEDGTISLPVSTLEIGRDLAHAIVDAKGPEAKQAVAEIKAARKAKASKSAVHKKAKK